MLQESLDLDFPGQSLNQFFAHFLERNLLYCSYKFSCIVLSSVNISESSLSQYFSKFEIFEKRLAWSLLAEDLGPLGLLHLHHIAIGRSEYFSFIIHIARNFRDLKSRHLNIFDFFGLLEHLLGPICLDFSGVVLGRSNLDLNDWDVELLLTLGGLLMLEFLNRLIGETVNNGVEIDLTWMGRAVDRKERNLRSISPLLLESGLG
jgi:hypothetical protein